MSSSGSRSCPASSVNLWLGLFFVLYSAGFLSVAPRLAEYPTPLLKAASLAWVAVGLALFAAGGLALARGLGHPGARLALAVAAVLYGLRTLYGTLAYGNPFRLWPGVTGSLRVAIGLVADLAVVAVAVWLAAAAARGASRSFSRAGLVFLAALALQVGIVPLIDLLLYVATEPTSLRDLTTAVALVYAMRLLPTLVRGGAGIFAVLAVWTALARSEAASSRAAAPLFLWASADLLLLASLWLAWVGPTLAVTPPLAYRIRTSLFVGLPALSLLGLALAVARQGRRARPDLTGAPAGR